MTECLLKSPAEYLPWLERFRRCNRYAQSWIIRLEKHTNKHPALDGTPWGWYEVWPNNAHVGFWGRGKDDLKDVDVAAWNAEAARISSPQR